MEKPKSKRRPWDTGKPALRPMQERKRTDFYHTSRWTKESRAFREDHPLCRKCEEGDMICQAEVVDHIIPLEICEDPWDEKNWQSLCRGHNNIKAAQDKKLIQQYRKEHSK
jgi:5-methylcytosine-specific restriction endonuclease McrA